MSELALICVRVREYLVFQMRKEEASRFVDKQCSIENGHKDAWHVFWNGTRDSGKRDASGYILLLRHYDFRDNRVTYYLNPGNKILL